MYPIKHILVYSNPDYIKAVQITLTKIRTPKQY